MKLAYRELKPKTKRGISVSCKHCKPLSYNPNHDRRAEYIVTAASIRLYGPLHYYEPPGKTGFTQRQLYLISTPFPKPGLFCMFQLQNCYGYSSSKQMCLSVLITLMVNSVMMIISHAKRLIYPLVSSSSENSNKQKQKKSVSILIQICKRFCKLSYIHRKKKIGIALKRFIQIIIKYIIFKRKRARRKHQKIHQFKYSKQISQGVDAKTYGYRCNN